MQHARRAAAVLTNSIRTSPYSPPLLSSYAFHLLYFKRTVFIQKHFFVPSFSFSHTRSFCISCDDAVLRKMLMAMVLMRHNESLISHI